MPLGRAAWTENETALWARISHHSFEPEGQASTFVGRLARDHGWPITFARCLIDEYRRFCFLAVISRGRVTPSDEVDEVWHQHLTFSQEYWECWCRNVLQMALHHYPNTGGSAEAGRFTAQYAETLALYETYFGPPDVIYWSGTAQRFRRGPRFHSVDRDRTIVIPIPAILGRVKWRLRRVFALSSLMLAVTTGSRRRLTRMFSIGTENRS